MATKKRRVVLAYPLPETSKGGKTVTHKPGTELELDDVAARNLVRAGRARFAAEPQPADVAAVTATTGEGR